MTQKPVAWAVTACSRMFMGEFAEFDAKAEARRCGGTCVAYALYKTPVVAPDVLKDAERYRWLRRSQIELSLPHQTISMLIADQTELDAAIGGAND